MIAVVDYLEDEFSDVISKAQRGLELPTSSLSETAGLDAATARRLRSGEWNDALLDAVAGPLRLHAEGLRRLAAGNYRPTAPLPEGFRGFDAPAPMPGYAEMRVNSFLAHAPEAEEAVLFDTGTDLSRIEGALADTGRRLGALFLTHAHWDHIEVVAQVHEKWPDIPIYAPPETAPELARKVKAGDRLDHGGLDLEVRSTPGHAPHSFTYVIHGLQVPVAVVGDAIFAGSVGGMPPEAYVDGLAAIRREILALPDEAILAPGHGRCTTVGYEKAHNPFFAG